MANNSREIVLKILLEIDQEGAFSNISINRNINNEVSPQDEGLIREIVYGVLENRMYLDWVIKKFSKVRFKKISPVIKNILRMGIYQIIFMDKVPDRAAVYESVSLAKKNSHKGTFGFVNGVLRSISRKKESIEIPSKEKNPVEYLSIKYSHPKWMINRWIKEFGVDFTEELCNANNKKPKLNIRANTLKTSKENLIEKLKEKGFDAYECTMAKDGIIVENPVRITEIEEFKEGHFQIQDESSMLVAQIMNPREDSLVIDVASAPGGKATHIAEKMNNKGKIIARDVYDHKIKLIEGNADRLGLDIIEAENYNALNVDEKLVGKADYCLVDAPCSGLGLIRRKPDIKWKKEEDDIEKITSLQYKILENACKYLKREGVLIYSTCTIERDENINLIRKFLKDHDNFSLLGFEDMISGDNIETAKDGFVELFQHIHDTDGFFIVKLIKNRD
ncbi:16S rRNA (cytosine(967)-C(5))-methyltransferase RsmB [Sporosalibacterium faouarense]|uniref:16S rRNA (cytosine(967)-C(5))-methyltransferase RsmB n=1 Tax=Sporosalibacterium faouarense TaxID=516123 RepID=UPI00141C8A3E|nr:16S rRNA (cytosine(967)-C(5))-methyltransferase RsmB [Sporosalibacterium faouarense]MTI47723.1 16S rRNA (cytosine(967)-C(5))-methyltransferase RsmB [Bacillota bacterium]